MLKTFTALLIAISFCTYSSAQILTDSILTNLTKTVDSLPDGFTISIALIRGQEVEYLGIVKEKDTFFQVDLRDSLFEIGSVTKVFTSTLLSVNILENRLKIDDSVNKAFPFSFNDSIELSYLSLANHTSGLYRLPANLIPFLFTNKSNPYSEYSYDMFDEYLKDELELENKDSTRYSYSNLGAGLLAYSISKANSQSFEDMLKNSIFKPYKMNSTSFNLAPSFTGVGPYGNKTENWDFNALKGAGGLVSNASDLSRFVLAQFSNDNRELTLTRQQTFTVNDNMSLGLGWHILSPNTEKEKFWHNGGTGGFTSSLAFKTSNQTGVVILSNISALHYQSRAIDELVFQILELMK